MSVSGQNPALPGSSGSVYNATLKGKINGLEETVKALTSELNRYRDEISNLRAEKQELEQNLVKKTQDIRNTLYNDVLK